MNLDGLLFRINQDAQTEMQLRQQVAELSAENQALREALAARESEGETSEQSAS